MWQRWTSESVSSALSMHAGSGISHGAAPTTNALNLRFFHNLRFLNSSFAVSLVANCRIREAKETKTFDSWQSGERFLDVFRLWYYMVL